MTKSTSVDSLLAQLEHLPTRSTTAVEVLWLADDPRVSAGQLGRVIDDDEALTTRIMRMANSPYYGLSGRVSSATFAITVLGFDTVKAVAAAAAAGVMNVSMPDNLLKDASLTAAAAGMLAPRLGLTASEATSIGLLHNLGSMVLYRNDRAAHTQLLARASSEGVPLHQLEAEHFGWPGHELAAALLGRWSFPSHFVDALVTQHEPIDAPRSPLGNLLVAGMAVAAEILKPTEDEAEQARRQQAMALGLADAQIVAQVSDQAEGLHPAG